MSLLLSPMAKNSSAGFYNGVATQSVRLDDGSGASLSKTISGSPLTWTFSAWVKRSTLGTLAVICASRTVGSLAGYISFQTANTLEIELGSGNARTTTTLFRDTSAWYHVVVNSTGAGGTAKAYINNVEVLSWSPGAAPWLFTDTLDFECSIGQYGAGAYYYDGYMSEVNFVDGLALNPTYFGETKNGAWIPKTPDVSDYGTNGFRLQFDQVGVGTASASTIGADTSGKTNHLTSSGIVASDCDMPDSPENNFCTLNNNARGTTNVSTANGNLYFAKSGANYGNIFSTFALFGGKWYFEGRCHSSALAQIGVQEITNNIYQSSGDYGASTDLGMWDSRGYYLDEGTAGGSPPTYTTGDIIGVAFDVDAGKIWFSKNGTYNHSGDPANGTNQTTGSTNDLSSIGVTPAGNGESGGGHVLNFGQDASFGGAITAGTETDGNGYGVFKYAPPSGFLAICSANLPEPTIGANSDTQADDHFNTVLFTGNGGTKAVTGLGFQPDWFWGKSRTNPSGVFSHSVYDSSRGVTKRLLPDLTNAESTTSGITSFDADGFTLGSNGGNNNNNATYVNWCWKANGGTATASGSESGNNPAYSVQANPTAGFSIVTYTGTGATGTVPHGLGVVPQMMIFKNRGSAGNWAIYHGSNTAAPATDVIYLNLSNATADTVNMFNDTAPTSSVFTVDTNANINEDGVAHVAYIFADVEGYSKFGGYTGNSNNDGSFVYTGFRPAMVMVKRTTGADSWFIYDIKRNSHNVMDKYLLADTSGAEATDASPLGLDMVSNGFKWRINSGARNTTGQTYIYMAFGDSFKYANAR